MCHLSTSLIDSYDVHLAFKVHLNIGYNCPFRGHIKPLPTSNASQKTRETLEYVRFPRETEWIRLEVAFTK